MKRTHAISCTAMLLATTPALADGGVVAWTGERLDARAAVIVSPASMRVGAVEFAWIGPWRAGATVVAIDQHGHTVSALLTQVAFDTEVRATLELPTEGVWNIALDPDGAEPAVSHHFGCGVAGVDRSLAATFRLATVVRDRSLRSSSCSPCSGCMRKVPSSLC